MHTGSRAAVASSLLFLALSASAQVLPKGIVATVEQRVAAPRPGGAAADNQRLVGIVPASDGLTALSWRANSQLQSLHAVEIDRTGRADATSERELTKTSTTSTAGSTGLAMVTWSAGGTLRISPLGPDGKLSYPDGKVLAVSIGTPTSFQSHVQCTPDRCLVTWDASPGIASLVDGSGNLVTRVSIPDDAELIASDLTGFLLARVIEEETSLLRLDANGLDSFFTILTEAAVDDIAADFDGTTYVVAFIQLAGGHSVFVQKLALSGTLGAGVELFAAAPGDDYSGIDIGSNGGEHLVAISSGRKLADGTSESNIYTANIDQNLAALRPTFALTNDVDAVNAWPVVMANGPDFFVAWHHAPSPSASINKILGVQKDSLGRLSPRATLWHGGVTAQQPATIASTPSHSLAVWTESDVDADGTAVRAARVAAGGTPIDPASLELGGARAVAGVDSAALGSDVLVVWQQATAAHPTPDELQGAIVRIDGAVQRVSISGVFATQMSVAADNDSWLIAGVSPSGGLFAVRISRSGLVLTPQPVTLLTSSVRTAAVASNGSGFLVAASLQSGTTIAIPLRADGTRAGGDRQVSNVSPAAIDLVSNGRDYLLASAAGNLTTTLLNADGSIAAGPFSTSVVSPTRVAAARMGSGWLVLWTAANGSAAARLNSTGAMIETPFAISPLGPVASRSTTSVATLFAKAIDGVTATMYRELIEVEAPHPRRRTTARSR